MNSIYSLSLEDLQEYLAANGFKPFHAKQIFKWLYDKRVDSFDKMTDISIKLQNRLMEDFAIERYEIVEKQISSDGTIKFLFKLSDDQLIESVLMVFNYGFSACLTTQVGCNMGCSFCASGLLKKQRNLEPGEIVLQALMIQLELDKREGRLGNIVLMGTGEPFDNYDNVMKALSVINSPYGIEIGARHISISTSGLAPMIRRFAKEDVQYNLAISLHAANNELRSKLMPINKAYPLEELFDALREYASLSNRRLTFEYLLLKGINDQKKDAMEIRNLLKGLNAYINLIPYNAVKEKGFVTSDEENTLRFYDMLKKLGVSVTLRQKKGDDIDAACGQLRANHLK